MQSFFTGMFTFFQARPPYCYSLTFSAGFQAGDGAAAVVRVAVCLPARAYLTRKAAMLFSRSKEDILLRTVIIISGVSLYGIL